MRGLKKKIRQMRRSRFIAFLDALLIGDVGLHLLAQDKQQLRSPVPLQTLRNFLLAGFDVRIGQCRKFVPIALAPSKIAFRIAMPVTPLMSIITLARPWAEAQRTTTEAKGAPPHSSIAAAHRPAVAAVFPLVQRGFDFS
jgi:hypothetical protein